MTDDQKVAVLSYLRSHGKKFDIHEFWGKWLIIRTSRTFWQRRLNPSVTYTTLEPGVQTKLLEIVHYGAFAKTQTQVIGIDTQDKAIPNLFHWRGRSGLTWLMTGQWVVLDHDLPRKAWAVVYFFATPFAPAGIDIYARQLDLPVQQLDEIVRRLQAHAFWAADASALFAPTHEKPRL